MSTLPLVSIIIPYYHGERFIAETLDSLLNQNYPSLEIIVVSDGSHPTSLVPITQKISELERSGRTETITLLQQENQGQAAARNLGIQHARGTIIGMIDQDDIWPAGRLAKTVGILIKGNYDFIRGHTQKLIQNHDGLWITDAPVLLPALIGAALYTKSTIDQVGPFDPTLREGEDFDWNARLDELHLNEQRIEEVTLLWRQHAHNQSAQKDYIKNGQLLSLKRKLERARRETQSR